MRIAWRTVGAIITRVWADTSEGIDAFAGLRRIGIDEISYKRKHKYLTVVVDHDTGQLVWAKPGRDRPRSRSSSTRWKPPAKAGRRRSPTSPLTALSGSRTSRVSGVLKLSAAPDPFRVVGCSTDALDVMRRDAWNPARRAGNTKLYGWAAGRRLVVSTGHARALKNAGYALWKNPENLTENQQAKLAWIAKTDPRLHRAYLPKEAPRTVFRLPLDEAAQALDRWIAWARRCRIETLVKIQARIAKHRAEILAAIEHGLSNGLVESVNTKIRLITRAAFGLCSPDALIALAMLNLGDHRPARPGR